MKNIFLQTKQFRTKNFKYKEASSYPKSKLNRFYCPTGQFGCD